MDDKSKISTFPSVKCVNELHLQTMQFLFYLTLSVVGCGKVNCIEVTI